MNLITTEIETSSRDFYVIIQSQVYRASFIFNPCAV